MTNPKYIGMTQITQEQADLMIQNYTPKEKMSQKIMEVMKEIDKDKVLDAVNQLENKLMNHR